MTTQTIAIGSTRPQGKGLAFQSATAGYTVILGSSTGAEPLPDSLVVGQDDAKQAVVLAESIVSNPAIDAGKLRLTRQLQPRTAVLTSINKRYKVHAGVSIMGMDHHG